MFHYLVHHDDGSSPIELDTSIQTGEWAFLGTFFFSPGEAKIVLTDETDGRLVYADAIKLVRR